MEQKENDQARLAPREHELIHLRAQMLSRDCGMAPRDERWMKCYLHALDIIEARIEALAGGNQAGTKGHAASPSASAAPETSSSRHPMSNVRARIENEKNEDLSRSGQSGQFESLTNAASYVPG